MKFLKVIKQQQSGNEYTLKKARRGFAQNDAEKVKRTVAEVEEDLKGRDLKVAYGECIFKKIKCLGCREGSILYTVKKGFRTEKYLLENLFF
ncbi:MAG: hypothetical protein LUG24_00285 [Clostridiales bacterium]|nr:hypothetical protein [Clostridiales bacterium]